MGSKMVKKSGIFEGFWGPIQSKCRLKHSSPAHFAHFCPFSGSTGASLAAGRTPPGPSPPPSDFVGASATSACCPRTSPRGWGPSLPPKGPRSCTSTPSRRPRPTRTPPPAPPAGSPPPATTRRPTGRRATLPCPTPGCLPPFRGNSWAHIKHNKTTTNTTKGYSGLSHRLDELPLTGQSSKQ